MAEFERTVHGLLATATGSGPHRILSVLARMNRTLSENEPLRTFLEQDQASALRLLTSSGGPVQPGVVATLQELIEQISAEDGYTPPIDPPTLAYAIARLCEAFLYNDAVVGLRGEVDRLEPVLAALLGSRLSHSRSERP